MKLTLTYAGRFTTKKDGSPLVSAKTGKPYTSLRIKANEYGDKYLSGFESAETRGWKEGDVVEANVEQKGEYLNFSVPRVEKAGMSPEQYQTLSRTLVATNENVLRCYSLLTGLIRDLTLDKVIHEHTSDGMPVPDFDVPPSQQPNVDRVETDEEPPIEAYEGN